MKSAIPPFKKSICNSLHSLLLLAITVPNFAYAAVASPVVAPSPFLLTLLAIAGLFIGGGAIIAIRQWRRYKNTIYRRILREIPAQVLVGYYRYDLKNCTETLSTGLKTALCLPDSSDGFESFKGCFSESCYQKLQDLCEKGLYSLDSVPPPIIVDFFSPVTKNNQWFECVLTVNMVVQDKEEVITVWFRDISDTRQEQQRLIIENESLVREIDHMAQLLDAVPFPLWSRNESLHIDYGNSAYKNLIGLTAHERYMYSLAQLSKQTGQLQQGSKHVIVEGKRRLFQLLEIPVTAEGTVMGVGYDITRQEEIEKDLQCNISAQSDLLESSSSAMAIYGADTRLKSFNQAFMKLWELDEVWLESEPTYALFLETLREKRKLPEQINFLSFKQEHLKLFTDITEPYNEFFHLPDGRSFRMIAIPHALGGLLFAYEDMTDKLALESSYNMLAAVQRATLDNLCEGIAVIGQDGRLKLYNPVYMEMWHHNTELLDTKPHFSFLLEKVKYLYKYGNNWPAVKERVLNMLSSRVVLRERVERTDGSVIDRLCVPLPDGATLMSYMDVTDSIVAERSLRERNEALQDVDRIKTEFLANVSYELRSPLTSIMGLSEALEKQYFGGLNERQKEYVEGIYASSQQLMSLINDILDLTSIEAGNMELDKERFDIHSVLSSVLSLVKERLKEEGINFFFDCRESIGTMIGDGRRIKQLVLKLLSNAIEYTPADGRIILGVKESSDHIVIWIEDTGEGIALAEQQAVFSKFYRTETTRMRGKSGAGLGLSVVKNFVELHGGRIELESVLGAGTKVSCFLPRGNELLVATQDIQQTQHIQMLSSKL